MNNKYKCSLLIFALSILISCKKEETPLLSTKDGLVGSWQMQFQGSDLNKNLKFDANEKNMVPDTGKFSYQLSKVGTGFRIGANSSYVDTMDWILFNNESTLHFKIYNKGFTNNQFFKFENSASTLLLIDTTVSPSFFRLLTRQD
jgi:hypothetical protein